VSKYNKPLIFFFLFYLLSGVESYAADWKQNRVLPLEKVTVGPWDNFGVTINANDSVIYYTRDSNQISNVYFQDLKSAEVKRYVGEHGDAKQAVLNSTGDILAITYYKDDAQGDICLVKTADHSIKCITDKSSVDQTPFWIDVNTLGFLRRPSGKLSWQLIEYDLVTKKTKTLSTGLISAPVASPNGNTVLFNEIISGKVLNRIFNRQKRSIQSLASFDLSGITGFFSFSRDGKFVYFNHYLNDTNADQKIDGNDNSVVFRIPVADWFESKSIVLPEQLTSVNNNCKFPALSNQYLYVTCAFEGSLDIYRLPLTGVVPATWKQEALWEAHKAARSYEQRLLLLNSLRYRFKQSTNHELLEKVLSNHLEIGELTAATYYINQLLAHYKSANKPKLVEFYQVLNELLYVRSSKQRVPVNIVTTRFQKVVSETREKLDGLEDRQNLRALINAYLTYELEDNKLALETLQRINIKSELLPLERYLIFELYKTLLLPEKAESLLQLYPDMFNESSISAESRLFYAFSYLKLLNTTVNDLNRRVETVTEQMQNTQFKPIATLFESELLSLSVSLEEDNKAQGKLFKELRTLLGNNKVNPLLRKAMHTRAIQMLSDANQFTYMELLSRNWLAVTHISEMEFINVADQYSIVSMNKAYGEMANSEYAKAYSIFYSAIRSTNDLEAHFQFITLGLTPELNKKDNLKKSYELLKKQNLLGGNQPYVDALQLIIDAESKSKPNTKKYEDALVLLSDMQVSGLNPSMRDLLMGYLYHQKLRISQNGYAYDKSFFQRAHHHYMMALDLAQDNARIAATVWQNLGWLQFEVRQYGLAADFFEQRLRLPFIKKMDEIGVRWMLARTQFYNNRKPEALAEAETMLNLVSKNNLGTVTSYLEKAAFYAVQAEEYDKAITYYNRLFKDHQLSTENEAKARLAYAYSLMESKRTEEAGRQFEMLLELSSKMNVLPKNNDRLVALYPQRFQLLAYGFLAKLNKNSLEQIQYRQRRIGLFEKMSGKASDFAYDEAGRLSFISKDYQHMAEAYENQKDYSNMVNAMFDALQISEKWASETGDEVGPVIYRTLLNYLTLNISHSDVFTDSHDKIRDKVVNQTLKAFEEHPYRSSLIVYQHTKLQVLWAVINNKNQPAEELVKRFNELMNSDDVKLLEKQLTLEFEELQSLVEYFS